MPKMILDLDTGIDDAMALAYAIARDDIELIGVTSTYGNVAVERSARNTLALLELLGHEEIPVFIGPGHASDQDSFEVLDISRFIHGVNGIGEVELPEPQLQPQDKSAVDFLVESVRSFGDDLVIVPTGPSTTIAAACAADPEFAQRAHIVMMGGALIVPGNVNAWTEANICQDPQASDQLLRQAADLTMVGLDVTLQTLLTNAETQKWRETGSEAGKAYADMVDYYIRAYGTTAPHLGGCGLHDPLAVAVAADPSFVELLPVNLKVDTEGPTRGRTIGDEARLLDEEKTSKVAVGVDIDRFVADLVTQLSGLFNVDNAV